MYNPDIMHKKHKTKRIKPELIIEEKSPKNITLKSSSSKFKKKPKKVIEFNILDKPEEIIEVPLKKSIDLINSKNKNLSKIHLKRAVELEIMEEKKRYNEEFVNDK